MERLMQDVLDHMASYYDELVRLLPRLTIAILVFIGLYLFSNWIYRITGHRLNRRMRDPLLAQFLAKVAKTIVVLIAIVSVMRIIGLGGLAAGVMAGAGVGAFIVGFAFKDIGENFLAGMLLAFKRPFRIGDTVEINAVKGKVVALNLRDTQIKTGDGRDVFIPNANIMKNPIMNYTLDGFLRYDFLLRLEAGTDILTARSLIKDVICKEPTILAGDRAPKADVAEVGPNYVDLQITFWLDHDDKTLDVSSIKAHVIQHVRAAVRAAGMHPPGNVVDVNLRK